MNSLRLVGLHEPKDSRQETELLLDTEFMGNLGDTEGGDGVPATIDLDVLDLDKELEFEAEASRPSLSADPCIRVAITPGPMRPRSAHKAQYPGASSRFSTGALARQLAIARDQAALARTAERRSHDALYQAVGSAYDFALVAIEAPVEFACLIDDPAIEARKLMTTIVKLVFGFEYDKTRVAEYAAVLTFACRLDIERGSLAGWLSKAPGGLKGVIAAEREFHRRDEGVAYETKPRLRPSVAAGLRALPVQKMEEIGRDGKEFMLIVARREPDGHVVVLGEVSSDVKLLTKAAAQLVQKSD